MPYIYIFWVSILYLNARKLNIRILTWYMYFINCQSALWCFSWSCLLFRGVHESKSIKLNLYLIKHWLSGANL